MQSATMRAAPLLFGTVVVMSCHSEKPTMTSDSPAPSALPSATASASASASGPTLGPAAAHVALGSNNVEENKVYSVDGTTLRFTLKNSMRATMTTGGHVWSGQLTVCDGAACTDLHLAGPDQPPGEWHGFEFLLAFVTPTSLTISRK